MFIFNGVKELIISLRISLILFLMLISIVPAFGDANDTDMFLVLTNLENKAKNNIELILDDYTIEDVPLLINSIDFEMPEQAGLVNKALQVISGVEKPLLNGHDSTDKDAWQGWWDSLHGKNRCVSSYFADWFLSIRILIELCNTMRNLSQKIMKLMFHQLETLIIITLNIELL